MSKYSELLGLLEQQFLKEIEQEGLNWRLLRVTTVVDLIVLSFVTYQSTGKTIHLRELLLWTLKAKIIYRLGEIKISSRNSTQLINDFKAEQPHVLASFNQILAEISNYSFNLTHNLYDKIEYLKTLSHLELDNIHEDILNDIFIHCVDYYFSE